MTSATTRFTNGVTSKSVGKATTQDRPHAANQVEAKPGEKPRLRAVAMADTTNVMNSDSMSGMTMPV